MGAQRFVSEWKSTHTFVLTINHPFTETKTLAWYWLFDNTLFLIVVVEVCGLSITVESPGGESCIHSARMATKKKPVRVSVASVREFIEVNFATECELATSVAKYYETKQKSHHAIRLACMVWTSLLHRLIHNYPKLKDSKPKAMYIAILSDLHQRFTIGNITKWPNVVESGGSVLPEEFDKMAGPILLPSKLSLSDIVKIQVLMEKSDPIPGIIESNSYKGHTKSLLNELLEEKSFDAYQPLFDLFDRYEGAGDDCLGAFKDIRAQRFYAQDVIQTFIGDSQASLPENDFAPLLRNKDGRDDTEGGTSDNTIAVVGGTPSSFQDELDRLSVRVSDIDERMVEKYFNLFNPNDAQDVRDAHESMLLSLMAPIQTMYAREARGSIDSTKERTDISQSIPKELVTLVMKITLAQWVRANKEIFVSDTVQFNTTPVKPRISYSSSSSSTSFAHTPPSTSRRSPSPPSTPPSSQNYPYTPESNRRSSLRRFSLQPVDDSNDIEIVKALFKGRQIRYGQHIKLLETTFFDGNVLKYSGFGTVELPLPGAETLVDYAFKTKEWNKNKVAKAMRVRKEEIFAIISSPQRELLPDGCKVQRVVEGISVSSDCIAYFDKATAGNALFDIATRQICDADLLLKVIVQTLDTLASAHIVYSRAIHQWYTVMNGLKEFDRIPVDQLTKSHSDFEEIVQKSQAQFSTFVKWVNLSKLTKVDDIVFTSVGSRYLVFLEHMKTLHLNANGKEATIFTSLEF